jgi:hypothetical protein
VALDYEKIRQSFLDQKKELEQLQVQIGHQIAGLNDQLNRNHRELIMIDEVLESLDLTKDGPPEDLEEVGLTDMVRRILQESSIALSPTQIRDMLLMKGYKASSLKAALISVHTVLDRIMPSLEQVEIDKRKAYKWKATENTKRETFLSMSGKLSDMSLSGKLSEEQRRALWGKAPVLKQTPGDK